MARWDCSNDIYFGGADDGQRKNRQSERGHWAAASRSSPVRLV